MSAKKTDKAGCGRAGNPVAQRHSTGRFGFRRAELRDQRELLRLRMFLVRQRTQWKNRIHGALARYNVRLLAAKDVFTQTGREELGTRLTGCLPRHTRASVESST